MARKRTIDPSIWTDEAFVSVGIPERLMYIGLISNADDDGRLSGSPAELTLKIFPNDKQACLNTLVWRDSLQSAGLIHVYCANKKTYIQLKGWHKHQKLQWYTKSLIPSPESPVDIPLSEPSALEVSQVIPKALEVSHFNPKALESYTSLSTAAPYCNTQSALTTPHPESQSPPLSQPEALKGYPPSAAPPPLPPFSLPPPHPPLTLFSLSPLPRICPSTPPAPKVIVRPEATVRMHALFCEATGRDPARFKLSDKKAARYAELVAWAGSEEDAARGIRKVGSSAHHRGQNATGKRYDDLDDKPFRTADAFRGWCEEPLLPAKRKTDAEEMYEHIMRNQK